MNDSDQNKNIIQLQGPSWTVVLFIIFLILKLTNVLDWPWVWITAPLWIGASIGIGCLLIALFVSGILALIAWKENSNK